MDQVTQTQCDGALRATPMDATKEPDALQPPPTIDELMAAAVKAQLELDASFAALYATDAYKATITNQQALKNAVSALEDQIPQDAAGLALAGYEAKWASRTATNYSLDAIEGVLRALATEDVADRLLMAAVKTSVSIQDLRSEVELALAKGLVPPDILERIDETAEKKTTHSFVFKPLPKSRGGKGRA